MHADLIEDACSKEKEENCKERPKTRIRPFLNTIVQLYSWPLLHEIRTWKKLCHAPMQRLEIFFTKNIGNCVTVCKQYTKQSKQTKFHRLYANNHTLHLLKHCQSRLSPLMNSKQGIKIGLLELMHIYCKIKIKIKPLNCFETNWRLEIIKVEATFVVH